MSTTTDIAPGQPAAPRPQARPNRRWRWWYFAIAFPVLIVVVPAVLFTIVKIQTNSAWDRAVAEADQDIPRWRLMDLEADRPQVDAKENSALFMVGVVAKAKPIRLGAAPNYAEMFDNLRPTAQLNTQQIQHIRDAFARAPKAVEEARQLKDMPRGRFPIKYSDDFIATLMPDHQNARSIANVLQHDAFLLAQEEKYDDAVDSCRAILNGARALEGELTLVGMLIRVAIESVATGTLERVLAQGEASEQALAALQTALEEADKGNHFLQSVRGERAGQHHLFDNCRTGKIKMSQFSGLSGMTGATPSMGDRLVDVFPSVMLQYFPEHLNYLNQTVEACKLPVHEREAKLGEMDLAIRKSRNILTRLLAPAMNKVSWADARNHINLRTAFVAVACERYRKAHQDRWPASLDDLVKAKLLSAVPIDPMDGKPLRFAKTKDGVVIYSIGYDKVDNRGKIEREHTMDTGVDMGFQLWDRGRRRQDPLPPVEQPEGDIK